MKTAIKVKTTLDIAYELMDFFAGSYAEKALQAAIDSKNEDLLYLAVTEYSHHRAEFERLEAESVQRECF